MYEFQELNILPLWDYYQHMSSFFQDSSAYIYMIFFTVNFI
jgi:hypothetical protein